MNLGITKKIKMCDRIQSTRLQAPQFGRNKDSKSQIFGQSGKVDFTERMAPQWKQYSSEEQYVFCFLTYNRILGTEDLLSASVQL